MARGSGLKATGKKKEKNSELTITSSATSSPIASSSLCAPSAAAPSLRRDARTAATLRETSARAARLRSSAAAPAREAAEAISRSATAWTNAGGGGGAAIVDAVAGVDAADFSSSSAPALTRAHRISVDRASTSVAQSASMEAGVSMIVAVFCSAGEREASRV